MPRLVHADVHSWCGSALSSVECDQDARSDFVEEALDIGQGTGGRGALAPPTFVLEGLFWENLTLLTYSVAWKEMSFET